VVMRQSRSEIHQKGNKLLIIKQLEKY